jgi:hypothetical protein
MKTIDTLVEDIHKVFELPHEFSPERMERFSKRLARSVARKVNPDAREARLSMSVIGTKCSAKLWYKVNKPELAEALPVQARIKFLYGDLLEELLLFLAEEAGHTVEGVQDAVLFEGIPGHRDAVIDGVVVDVKSASTYSFKKFKEHLTYAEDAFGYIDQIQGYLKAADNDPLVKDHNRAAFLVIDKTLGHITLDIHPRSDLDFAMVARVKKGIVANRNKPRRLYEPEPEGKSGNEKLCMECSYCEFKKACWPGLRTFLYSRGPVHLTKVAKLPDVPEAGGAFEEAA